MFSRKPIEYDSAAPPLNKPISQLSKMEAQGYFIWYVNRIDERIKYLRGKSKLPLDYSPESLVRLWKWFLKNARMEATPAEALEALRRELQANNPLFAEDVFQDHMLRFTAQTEGMLCDIGMYLGELFLRNHSSLSWGQYTYPKEDVFVNQPLLVGFPNEFFLRGRGLPSHRSIWCGFRHPASAVELLIIEPLATKNCLPWEAVFIVSN